MSDMLTTLHYLRVQPDCKCGHASPRHMGIDRSGMGVRTWCSECDCMKYTPVSLPYKRKVRDPDSERPILRNGGLPPSYRIRTYVRRYEQGGWLVREAAIAASEGYRVGSRKKKPLGPGRGVPWSEGPYGLELAP